MSRVLAPCEHATPRLSPCSPAACCDHQTPTVNGGGHLSLCIHPASLQDISTQAWRRRPPPPPPIPPTPPPGLPAGSTRRRPPSASRPHARRPAPGVCFRV